MMGEGEEGEAHLAADLRQQFRKIGMRLHLTHIADERICSVEHLRRGGTGRSKTPDPLAAFPDVQEPGLNRPAWTIIVGVPRAPDPSRTGRRGAT